MSGHSDSGACPVCGGSMDTYNDYKPFDNVYGLCLDCGFTYWTERGQASLEEINERREEAELPKLKKADLLKWKKEIENL